MADFDSSEVHKLAEVITEAPGVAPAEARKVLQKGLLNIKTDGRRRIQGSSHFRRVAPSITYESHETRGGGWGEVGPEHGRPQANLAFIAENGSLRTAPQPFMGPAGATEEPKFLRAMEALGVKATGLQ